MPPVSPTGPVPPEHPLASPGVPTTPKTTEPASQSIAVDKKLYKPILIATAAAIGLQIVSAMISAGSNRSISPPFWLGWVYSAAVVAVAAYSLVLQWKYFASQRPIALRLEIAFFAAASLALTIGVFLGDQAGAQAFNNSPTFTLSGAFGVILVSAGIATFWLAIGNALYIATGFNKIVKVLGCIAYGVSWVVIAILAYFAYTFQYSSHDPNSE